MLLRAKKKIKLTLVIVIALASTGQAQEADHSALFDCLRAKDSLLFTLGFNQCEIQQIRPLIHEDFEFYHDRGGITESKEAFIATIEDNICSSGTSVTTRELDHSSLTVHPLYKGDTLYGAVQTGIHYFDGTAAKFTHVWLLDNNEWKLSRVLSYDHQAR